MTRCYVPPPERRTMGPLACVAAFTVCVALIWGTVICVDIWAVSRQIDREASDR